MTEKFKIDTEDGPDKNWQLENKRIDIGWLGKFFGTGENASVYIAGVIALVFTVAGIVCLFCESKVPPEKFWSFSAPVISLSLGYIFGKKI